MQHKYVVDIYHQANEDSWSEKIYQGNDPRLAIEVWAEAEPNNRTCVSINVAKREHAFELIQYAYENFEWLDKLCNERMVSYNRKYLEVAITHEFETRCESFHEYPVEDDYIADYYRDQVHPFDLG